MNSVLGIRVINNPHARLLLYGLALLVVVTLGFIHFCAKRSSEMTWWATDPQVNWVRDLYTVDSPEELRSAFTIMEISYMNGRLSAFCALKNADPAHGIVVQIATDGEGLSWSPATLQVSSTSTGPWKEIGVVGDSRAGEAKVLRPGDAVTFKVDLNAFMAVLQKYQYGRIVMGSGAAATFNFDLLQPPPMHIPTREEMRQERKHEIELTPKAAERVSPLGR